MKTMLTTLALILGTMTLATTPAGAQVYLGVHIGPPAPIVERRPPPPGPGYAWRAGAWRWNGVRYVWRGGYYVHPPYGRAAWIPGHWVESRHRWVYREGHWA